MPSPRKHDANLLNGLFHHRAYALVHICPTGDFKLISKLVLHAHSFNGSEKRNPERMERLKTETPVPVFLWGLKTHLLHWEKQGAGQHWNANNWNNNKKPFTSPAALSQNAPSHFNLTQCLVLLKTCLSDMLVTNYPSCSITSIHKSWMIPRQRSPLKHITELLLWVYHWCWHCWRSWCLQKALDGHTVAIVTHSDQ